MLWEVADSSVPESCMLRCCLCDMVWKRWSVSSPCMLREKPFLVLMSRQPLKAYRKYGYVWHSLANTATVWQKSLLTKLKGPCMKFTLLWKTTQVNCFLSCKDKTHAEWISKLRSLPASLSWLQKLVYIGKTDRCLFTRLITNTIIVKVQKSMPTLILGNTSNTSKP